MPTWLNIAIWIIMFFWSAYEITFFYAISSTNKIWTDQGFPPVMRYSEAKRVLTCLWLVAVVLCICYLIWG